MLIACAEGLPDNLDQSSTGSALETEPLNAAAPLDFIATSYVLQVGNQASLAPSGGIAPYAYSMSGPGAGTITANVFTATTAGNVTITVTDAAGVTDSLDILISVVTTGTGTGSGTGTGTGSGTGTTVTPPLTTMSTDYVAFGAVSNPLPRYKYLVNQEADTTTLYLCTIESSVINIFNGTAGNCPNGSLVLGYIYTTQKPGTVALHRVRMQRISPNLQYYTMNAEATSVPTGWTDGGILGYVPQ